MGKGSAWKLIARKSGCGVAKAKLGKPWYPLATAESREARKRELITFREDIVRSCERDGTAASIHGGLQ